MNFIEFYIANPIFDSTFWDLFGSGGTIANGFGPKERLISFLNEIYKDTDKDEQIARIKYKNSIRTLRETQVIMCKCYNSKGSNIYDVEIQKNIFLNIYNEDTLDELRLLSYNVEELESLDFSNLSPLRVLSIITNDVFDSSKPGIFTGQINDEKYGDMLNKYISLTYIQFPIIREKGTNIKWLRFLSMCDEIEKYIKINITKWDDDVFISCIRILKNTYNNKSDELLYELRHILDEKRSEYARKEHLRKKGFKIGQRIGIEIGERLASARFALNLKINWNYSNEKIAELLYVNIEFVNFVDTNANLSQSYINQCKKNDEEPDFEVFLQEARKQIIISEENLEIVKKIFNIINESN